MHELEDHAVISRDDVVRFTRANKAESIVSKLWKGFCEEVFRLNFYRLHMAYFLITILISSLIMYGSGIVDDPTENYGSHLEYIDALFLCTSAMTATGRPHVASIPYFRPGKLIETRLGHCESQYFDRVPAGRSRNTDPDWEHCLCQHFASHHPPSFLPKRTQ